MSPLAIPTPGEADLNPACRILRRAGQVATVFIALCAGAAFTRAADVDAELERLAAEFGIDLGDSLWDTSCDFETAVGHRENTTLSPFTPDPSGLVRASVGAIAWRRPQSGFDWMNLLDASATRFFSADTNHALLFLGRSEGRWRRGEPVEITLAAQFVHQDEVIDVSTLDYGLGSTRVRLLSPGLDAKIRWALATGWAITTKLEGRWNDFHAPLGDVWEHAGGITLERSLGRWGEVGVGYRQSWRDHGDRPQAALGGRELTGTKLDVRQQGGEALYRVSGGSEVTWTARLRAGHLENSDNGTGWYDYKRWHGAGTFSLEVGSWRIEVDLDWRDYEYRWQTSGSGLNLPAKDRRELIGTLRLEREVGERWAVFLEGEFDRSRSNDPYLEYDDSFVATGVRWSL